MEGMPIPEPVRELRPHVTFRVIEKITDRLWELGGGAIMAAALWLVSRLRSNLDYVAVACVFVVGALMMYLSVRVHGRKATAKPSDRDISRGKSTEAGGPTEYAEEPPAGSSDKILPTKIPEIIGDFSDVKIIRHGLVVDSSNGQKWVMVGFSINMYLNSSDAVHIADIRLRTHKMSPPCRSLLPLLPPQITDHAGMRNRIRLSMRKRLGSFQIDPLPKVFAGTCSVQWQLSTNPLLAELSNKHGLCDALCDEKGTTKRGQTHFSAFFSPRNGKCVPFRLC